MLIDPKNTSGETWRGLPIIRLEHGRWETEADRLYVEESCVEGDLYRFACGEPIDVNITPGDSLATGTFSAEQMVVPHDVDVNCEIDYLAAHEQAMPALIAQFIFDQLALDPDLVTLLAGAAADPLDALVAIEDSFSSGDAYFLGASSAGRFLGSAIERDSVAETTFVFSNEFPTTGQGQTTVYGVKNAAIILGPVEVIEGRAKTRNRICTLTVQSVAFVYSPCDHPVAAELCFKKGCC